MAEKLNICIVVVVVLAVVLLYTFIKHKPDHFARSSKFDKDNKMILVGPKGEIILKRASDIDSAINNIAGRLQRDSDNAYQPKGNYQPVGDYVRRGGWYRIYNKGGKTRGGVREDERIVLMDGSHNIRADVNVKDTEDWRYFKIS